MEQGRVLVLAVHNGRCYNFGQCQQSHIYFQTVTFRTRFLLRSSGSRIQHGNPYRRPCKVTNEHAEIIKSSDGGDIWWPHKVKSSLGTPLRHMSGGTAPLILHRDDICRRWEVSSHRTSGTR